MSDTHAQPVTGSAAAMPRVEATDGARDATRQVGEMAGDVQNAAARGAESGKDMAAERIEDMADAVHRSADTLRGREDWLAGLVDSGADSLAAVAETLRSNDLRGTLRRIENMARAQPALLAGASMAAGFALIRLGRAGLDEHRGPADRWQGDRWHGDRS